MRRLAAPACLGFLTAAFALGIYLVYLQWWVSPEMTRPQLFWAHWPLFVVDALMWGAAIHCFEVTLRRHP